MQDRYRAAGAATGLWPALVERWRASVGEGQAWGAIMAFLLPALLFFLLFTAYPIAKTVYNSFHIIRPNRPDVFVGFGNYAQVLFADAYFAKSLVNTLIWATVAPMIDVTLGLLLAACLYARLPFARFFRVDAVLDLDAHRSTATADAQLDIGIGDLAVVQLGGGGAIRNRQHERQQQ